MRLFWLIVRQFDVFPSGHPAGMMNCARYGHHTHLPLGMIRWYPIERND